MKPISNWFSANIFSTDGQQIFKAYEIIEFENKKIALIGLSSVFNHLDLIIKDPISILDNVIKDIELNYKTDIKILLFHANAADMKKMHQHDFKIDWIGFNIDERYFVGYGLDLNQKFRGLNGIYAVKH